MTIADWLAAASNQLIAADVQTARLDTQVLLSDVFSQNRAWLLAHSENIINDAQLAQLTAHLERRVTHEPLAYIRGFTEFYGRRFEVTPDVLIPRPESEAIIDLLKKLAPNVARVADVGTGSGALAITAVLEMGAVAAAVDIDEACLAVAQRNAALHTTPLTPLQGNLLEPVGDFAPEVLLANLPYVPDDYAINQAARHEPALALFAGSDGLDLYRTFFKQLTALSNRPQLILIEALPAQHPVLLTLAAAAGFMAGESQDFILSFS